MSTKTLEDVQPKAVMAPDELARWNELPADEQLARLRAAIQRGIDSGVAPVTMDEIWARTPHVIPMPSYEISVEAAADIEEIGDYGVSTFGFA
jgi:hypothetical protein